ncbi:hypothetical protein GCM10022222_01160 [Amycolatopsis ultiminotia]|uniref:SnoaL-like domain-containing protein n=1 Tax=Amycolatopsis ultiminotia TaxID=543629 RepID=A0ABP6UWH3_9PSEU
MAGTVDRFEQRNGRWAIASRVCLRDWVTVNERPDMNDPAVLTAIRRALSAPVRELLAGSAVSRRERRTSPMLAR